MDIPRTVNLRKKWLRRAIFSVLVISSLIGVSFILARLKPAAPTVERASAWLDTVKRGAMVRQVRGVGTLVPEELLWVPAVTNGRVQKVLMKPGALVTRDAILLVLSDPALQLAALEAQFKVKAAEAQYQDLRIQLKSRHLTQQADVARIESDYQQARLRADRNVLLVKDGLLADIDLQVAQSNADQLDHRRKIEEERLSIQLESIDAQLAVQKAEIERLQAMAELRRSEIDSLQVRAGTDGVLQELSVQIGQHVSPGMILAKVAQPQRLLAELKIPETQAKDVAIGQVAMIDTRNGLIPGRVSRIDPAVKEGTVLVDVKLEGDLPPGARPDLNVDGVIELEKLPDIVYIGRPALGQPHSTIGLFRLEPDGVTAIRVPVELGRSSVNTIEVIRGLQVGDTVILSDMSAWDSHDRIALR